jgi:hypothetical protein
VALLALAPALAWAAESVETTAGAPAAGAEESLVAQAGRMLPEPAQAAPGAVPLSEPVAPVPAGEPAWTFGGSALGGVSDAFHGKAVFLLSVRRGFGAWAVEAFGGPALSWPGQALSLCATPGTCGAPGTVQLGATPGQLTWLAGADAVVRAGVGKMSVGGLAPARFSLEAGLGPAAVGSRLVVGAVSDQVSPGARLALGVGVALSPELAVRGDLQGLGYLMSLRGASSFQTQLLAGLTFAWRPGAQR